MLLNQYEVEQIEKQLRLIWSKNELDAIERARERAEKEVEVEKARRKEEEAKAEIARLNEREARAREALRASELMGGATES